VSDGGEYTHGLGAGGQASLSEVRLGNGQGVVFVTTGAFYNAGTDTTRASAGSNYGTVFGASLGVGGGLVFTNAQTISDYSGKSTTTNFNIGPLSISYSHNDNGIRTFSIGAAYGPPGFSVPPLEETPRLQSGRGFSRRLG
jgi:hypothetical protein